MLRISKLTDYAIVVLSHAAKSDDQVVTARMLSEASHVPMPTVGKVMKSLARAGIVESLRGKKGGYKLARPASRITVAELIAALEGPVAMTECSLGTACECDIELRCPVRTNWKRINEVVRQALDSVSLQDLIQDEDTAADQLIRIVRTGVELPS